MNKAIMLSIRPKYCELIANGKKTIEVRKTKPKIAPPFKCYIYCTKPSRKHQTICGCMVLNDDELYLHPTQGIKHGDSIELMCRDDYTKDNFLNGKVVGEFVCDGIIPISITYSDPNNRIAQREFPYTRLTDKQIIDYLGNGRQGYGWHISDLVIYDKPRELREFRVICKYNRCDKHCLFVEWEMADNGEIFYDCKYAGYIPLMRAPQSCCYVEET